MTAPAQVTTCHKQVGRRLRIASCDDLQSSCERPAEAAGVVSRCAELLASRDDAAQEAMGRMLGREGDATEDLQRAMRHVERRATRVRLGDRCGLRGFANGQLPGPRRRKGQVEMYDRGQYVTVNGCSGQLCPRRIGGLEVEVMTSMDLPLIDRSTWASDSDLRFARVAPYGRWQSHRSW